jgi:hypothetical protein
MPCAETVRSQHRSRGQARHEGHLDTQMRQCDAPGRASNERIEARVVEEVITDGPLAICMSVPSPHTGVAVALGATLPEQPDPRWWVLLDPAGHPFCPTPFAPDTVD